MPFSPEVEQVVKTMYHSLREKDRRRYAAVETAKLGHGGVINDVFNKLCQGALVQAKGKKFGLDERRQPRFTFSPTPPARPAAGS